MKIKVYRVSQGLIAEYVTTTESGHAAGDGVRLPEGIYRFVLGEPLAAPRGAIGTSLHFVVQVRRDWSRDAQYWATVDGVDVEAKGATPAEAVERAVAVLSDRYSGVFLHVDVRAPVENGS